MKKPTLKQYVDASPFRQHYYQVDMTLRGASFGFYATRRLREHYPDFKRDFPEPGDDNYIPLKEYLPHLIPEFQRSNDKWSQEMQVKFVENIILGAKTSILMYTLEEDYKKGSYTNCAVLDGQQRLTAWAAFEAGDFTVFDAVKPSTFQELMDDRIITYSTGVQLRIYRFPTERDVIEFYISMNENITHSPDDILKASLFLETL